MFVEIPQNLILMTVGAFLLGWILASISARMGSRYEAKKRDPRDDRIRSLEAESRITGTDLELYREKSESLQKELEESVEGAEKRDNVIDHQQARIEKLRRDLKESVKKTRELRHELTDRATESLRSEVKLREVETELSVAQASTDMMATGVLDYSMAPELEEGDKDESSDDIDESDLSKAAT